MSGDTLESTERERRLHEVLGAYFEAVEAGQSPSLPDLMARHPDLATELNAFFADQDRFGALVGPLQPPPAASGPGPDPDVTTDLTGSTNGAAPALTKGTHVRYFGDYELVRELGQGGMGAVYQARQIS